MLELAKTEYIDVDGGGRDDDSKVKEAVQALTQAAAEALGPAARYLVVRTAGGDRFISGARLHEEARVC